MCALNKQYALNNHMYLTTSKYSILRTYFTVFGINTYLMYSLISQCHIMLTVSEKQYNNCEKYEYSTKKLFSDKLPLCYNSDTEYYIHSKYTYVVR